MSRKNLISNAWATFEESVIPAGAPELQKRDLKRAFYGGAGALLKDLMRVLDEGAEPTDEDLEVMDDVVKELFQFNKDVQEGRA